MIFSCQINKRGRLAPAAGSAPPRLRTPPRRSAGPGWKPPGPPRLRGPRTSLLRAGGDRGPPRPRPRTSDPAPTAPHPPPAPAAPGGTRGGAPRCPFPAHPRGTPSALGNLGGSVGPRAHSSPTLHPDPGEEEGEPRRRPRGQRRRLGVLVQAQRRKGQLRGPGADTPTGNAVLSGAGRRDSREQPTSDSWFSIPLSWQSGGSSCEGPASHPNPRDPQIPKAARPGQDPGPCARERLSVLTKGARDFPACLPWRAWTKSNSATHLNAFPGAGEA